jgi:hypothetical protein
MDRNPYAFIGELIKNGVGVFVIISQGDWFGLNSFLPGAHYIILLYFVLSTVISVAFCLKLFREHRTVAG